MYYYVRLLKNTPLEAVIQEPFKLVFTITTDLMEKFYDKPCKLRCQAVVRGSSTLPGSSTASDTTVTTTMPQGLSQGYSLDFDPNIGYCSTDIRLAPCGKASIAPPEYEILPAWSLPIRLKPAPLSTIKKKHSKPKQQVDTRQDLVERHFRLPTNLTGPGRYLLIREDAREGYMARHIWDSGVFMTKYLMLPDSWLSKYMKECREQDSKEPLTSSEDQPLESSLSSLSISGTSAASTVTEHSHTSTPSGRHERMCLELGAGTGLVGIAVAVAFPELSVLSTDLDEAMSLMQQNVDANQHLLPNNNMKVDVLDWAEKDRQVDPVEILLLADVVYNDLSHEMLLQTMLDYSNEKTKILLGYKFRHEAEQKFFVRAKEYFDMDMVHEQDTMQLFVMTRRPN
ncbi:hypothetical protein BGX31_000667 [Mortierella sp. GBA43]|nr:hypothetical protein BGX31_000667 [Mortierella sp. GBA43]